MSLPPRSFDPRRVCVLPLPSFRFLAGRKREVGVYLSGALFALGWWFFIDACILSARARPPPDAPYDTVPVHVSFVDWVPGICATLGMLVVNALDKQQLAGDGGGFSFGGGGAWGGGDSVAWKARLLLFVGFALMAGGLAGSVATFVIKYVVPDWPAGYEYYGVANIVQNAAIMLSAVLLWIAQNAESDYEYNLTL